MLLKSFCTIWVVFLISIMAAWSAFAADQSEEAVQPSIGGEIFGKQGGYVHGYLSVAERWTDNLFYTPDDTDSDFVTHVTPGIRLSLPGTKEDLLAISHRHHISRRLDLRPPGRP